MLAKDTLLPMASLISFVSCVAHSLQNTTPWLNLMCVSTIQLRLLGGAPVSIASACECQRYVLHQSATSTMDQKTSLAGTANPRYTYCIVNKLQSLPLFLFHRSTDNTSTSTNNSSSNSSRATSATCWQWTATKAPASPQSAPA